MATYKSEKTDINAPAEKVYRRFANPERIADILKNVPEDKITPEQKKQLEEIQLTPDSISLPGAPVGMLTLRITERVEPTLIRFTGEGSPIPMNLVMNITPLTDDSCETQVVLDIDIPAMLKPMINGPLTKMVNQFGTLMRQLGTLPEDGEA